jgi:hypothetical protein
MFYFILDTLLKVSLNTNNTWWPLVLVLNTTSNNMSVITYNMVTSIFGVEHHLQ